MNSTLKNELDSFLKINKLELIDKNLNDLTWKDKINLKCKICEKEFNIGIKQLLRPHPIRTTKNVCPRCATKEKFINSLVKQYGRNPYKILSSFDNLDSIIKVKCLDCKSTFETKAKNLLMISNLKKGIHPCKNCTQIRFKSGKNIKELEDELKKRFGECKYSFPDPSSFRGIYSKEKFLFKCKLCGNEFKAIPINVLQPKNGKHYCRFCNKKDRLLEKMSYKERCLLTTNGKIEPLEEYKDSRTKIKHRCDICGYEWLKVPVKNTKRSAGCPKCTKRITVSNAEEEISNFIKENYNKEIILKDRQILENNQELDIYLPDIKIAFEIDGLYWHSEEYKGKKYHLEKTIECDKKGIQLIHIFDDEWYFKQEIVKTKILNIIKENKSEKIYARNCVIADISKKEKDEFLEKYHIQGKDISSISKGLFYKNILVAVMTLTKPRKSLGNNKKKEGNFELSRFATSEHVVGGFSKLLKNILREHNEIKEITTFADMRWSNLHENVYTKNGFKLSHMSPPNYWYFLKNKSANSAKRIHRYNFRKQVLEKKFPNEYNKDLTEFQIMDKTNYKRIWDCGNLVYKLKI